MRPITNQLCQLAGEYRGKFPDGGTWVEQKIDGWRCLYFRDTLWTRNGHRINGASHIVRRCQEIERAAGFPLFLDGEFQVGGTLAATKAHCERGWRDGDAGHYSLFDMLPYRDWFMGECGAILIDRKAELARLFKASADDPLAWEWPAKVERAASILPDTWVIDADDLASEARRVWSAGGEGLMLKDCAAPYRRDRCKSWQKLKLPRQLYA